MKTIKVKIERRIGAPAAAVYSSIADYKNHHAHFLPSAFKHYRVESGGYGEGTIFSFMTQELFKQRAFRIAVEEPKPGQVLIERDLLSPLITTWALMDEGEACHLTVTTVFPSAPGFEGMIEMLVLPLSLRAVYADELKRLERYAKTLASSRA